MLWSREQFRGISEKTDCKLIFQGMLLQSYQFNHVKLELEYTGAAGNNCWCLRKENLVCLVPSLLLSQKKTPRWIKNTGCMTCIVKFLNTIFISLLRTRVMGQDPNYYLHKWTGFLLAQGFRWFATLGSCILMQPPLNMLWWFAQLSNHILEAMKELQQEGDGNLLCSLSIGLKISPAHIFLLKCWHLYVADTQ